MMTGRIFLDFSLRTVRRTVVEMDNERDRLSFPVDEMDK